MSMPVECAAVTFFLTFPATIIQYNSGAIEKIFFLFLNQNICCGYSKEPSFEHPKHMFKLMDKKIFTIILSKNLLIWTYDNYFKVTVINCSDRPFKQLLLSYAIKLFLSR